MKRLLAILLVLCLVLCGCEAGGGGPTEPDAPGQFGGNTVEPTRPAEVEPIEVDGAALCVTVTINPKFELYLDMFNMILDVKAQNEDAQKLLADLQVVGEPYSEGITQILAEAEQQGFLQNRAKLTIETRELVDGGWNPRSEATVLDPVEAYKAASGLVLTCEFYPAKKPLDEITYVHTNKRDGYKEEICYNIHDQHILTRMYFDDGSYWETHWVQGTEYRWEADGSYSCEVWKDGFSSSYTIHPDGTVDRVMRTVDKLGNLLEWELFLYADGSSWENFYDKSGIMTKSIYGNADGSSEENIYYPDGTRKASDYTHPNGDYQHDTYYENGEPATRIAQVNGIYLEYTYNENGEETSRFQRDPDGTEYDWDYENGEAAGYTVTYPDGSSEYHTYSP